MKVSLICPVYNEVDSIEYVIKSMFNQTKKPNEIIFVDSFSTDGTFEILKKYSKKYKNLKVIQKKSNISKARNIAIQNSKNEIIACTDASSKLDKNWLKELTKPFKDKSVSVVSGGYKAISKRGIEDYMSMLTVKPMSEWNEKTFLPSGRSIAFTKSAWKIVKGYPEHLYTGEDTAFDLKLKEKGFKFKLQKSAIVYWRGRNTLRKFIKQFWLYGIGDGKSRNLKKMKFNLIFFLGINIWIFLLFVSFIWKPIVGLIVLSPLFPYLFFSGIKYSFRSKKLGCLFWIPILLLLKRFSYFFGVWRGLIK